LWNIEEKIFEDLWKTIKLEKELKGMNPRGRDSDPSNHTNV
jgi:hypothetical protein